MGYTPPDWSKAPADAEAGIGEMPGFWSAWYKRNEEGDVCQICEGAQLTEWTWMGGRKDFPAGHELRIGSWNGEGLPPVGMTCEWFDIDCGRWLTVSVAYRSSWVIVLRDSNPHPDGPVEIAKEISRDSDLNPKLRPIRTPEQIAAEERKSGIQALLDTFNANFEGNVLDGLSAIWDAGYRKQVSP